MTTLRQYLHTYATENQKFEDHDCKTLEVWSDKNGRNLQERILQPDEIIPWIDQTGPFQPLGGTNKKYHLRLIYQEWAQSEGIKDQAAIAFSKDVFKHLLSAFSLAPDYLLLFSQSRYTPLRVVLPTTESQFISFVLQSPKVFSFTTLALSYDPKRGTTQGFLGFNKHDLNDNIITQLRGSVADASHPLLLPIILIQTWITDFREENNEQEYQVLDIKKINDKMSSPAFDSDAFAEFDEAQQIIIDMYYNLNNSVSAFVSHSTVNCHQALKTISDVTTDAQVSDSMRQSNEDFDVLLSASTTTINCEVDMRARVREKLSMQSQVLYNMMQREESKQMKETAEDSRRIAENSNRIAEAARNDSKAMKAIPEQSKHIAEFTQLDSSAMKTIAAVTMVFLLGTAIATIFSMVPFFEGGRQDGIAVSPQFWIYWIITTPVTCLVFSAWWLWTQREHKRIRKFNQRALGEDEVNGIRLSAHSIE